MRGGVGKGEGMEFLPPLPGAPSLFALVQRKKVE